MDEINDNIDCTPLVLEIERSLTYLPDLERDVIRLFYGLDAPALTLEGIGEKFGMTPESVNQTKERAIRRLRHSGSRTGNRA